VTLFISDLHLDESRPGATEAFYRFLRERAARAKALYILGDLFELWVGDDDDSALARGVKHALREVADGGTRVFFIHGNRDFLLGEQFAAEAGLQLLPDPTVVELEGRRLLLMHGDSLCTDDADYQAFRRQVRQPAWMADVLSKPLEERRALGRHLRQQSQSMNSRKAEDIMDVNAGAVAQMLRDHGADLLIHGHTHRPARHALDLDSGSAERIVLGDWDAYGWCLAWQDGRCELESWPLPQA